MKRAVLMSIQPRWCEKILQGEKTVEVRKTRPTLMQTPFKVYVYCTSTGNPRFDGAGKVIGEFVCGRIDRLVHIGYMGSGEKPKYRSIDERECPYGVSWILEAACLTEEELETYLKGETGFGWHISDLKIYDKPRKLDEFERPYECDECAAQWASECNACHKECKIKRPPQSWYYVEEYMR